MIDIISMLKGVRDNGGGSYMARCPAHDDRSPSLNTEFSHSLGRWQLTGK